MNPARMRDLRLVAEEAVRVAPGAWLPEEVSFANGEIAYRINTPQGYLVSEATTSATHGARLASIVRFGAKATPDAVLALIELVRFREDEITKLNDALIAARKDLARTRERKRASDEGRAHDGRFDLLEGT